MHVPQNRNCLKTQMDAARHNKHANDAIMAQTTRHKPQVNNPVVTPTVRGSSLPASLLYLRVDRGIGANRIVAGIARYRIQPKTGLGSWDVDWTDSGVF